MATNISKSQTICGIDKSKKEEKLVECKVYNLTLPENPMSGWAMFNEGVPVSELVGKQFEFIIKVDNEQLVFIGLNYIYIMCHERDCCECVTIDDICGDLQDLITSPIIVAEELHSKNILPKKDEWDESFTWTFYKFATTRGYVDIKWYGASNGYYSESADLYKISDEDFERMFKYYIQQIKKHQETL